MMMNFKPQALDMETLRTQAAASVNYTPNSMEASAISKKRDEAALSYVELTTDEPRDILGIGDEIRYHRQSYGYLDGVVMALDLETDRAQIRFDDQWGVRRIWCGLGYLQLLLKKSARDVEAEES